MQLRLRKRRQVKTKAHRISASTDELEERMDRLLRGAGLLPDVLQK